MKKSIPPVSAVEKLKLDIEDLTDTLLSEEANQFLDQYTRIMDDYFVRSYENSHIGQKLIVGRKAYALIAQGGYGRNEQCRHSDVDLLLLFEKKVPKEAEQLVQEIVYPLWDFGLEVGHATRSIKDCLRLASKDFEVLTSLLDARFICGFSPLFSTLMDKIRTRIINTKPNAVISWLIKSNRARHARFGDSSYLLEPNLKEGQGGLRDYHTMLWIARITSNIRQRRDLEFYGFLSHEEYRRLIKALNYIWNVRNQLHHLTGKKWDQLHLEHQVKLAEIMGINADNGHLPVEVFIGQLHCHMDFVKQRHEMFLFELEQQRRVKGKIKKLPVSKINGLKFNRGMLNFESPEVIVQNPELLFDIFLESVAQKAPLSAEAKRLITDFLYLVDGDFRSTPFLVSAFEKLMTRSQDTFHIFNDMLNTGFLEKFIPDFKHVTNRIQFDQYHLYPVAQHLLLTVRVLKSFADKNPNEYDDLICRLYQEIKHKKVLLWAALLHDIGKGQPETGHSERGAKIARRVLAEKRVKSNHIDVITFLIKEHLFLIKTATRRDINDEKTAIYAARHIRSMERLKMLFLLSVADSMATGPKAWNDWTAALLHSFFFRVLNILENGELATGKAVKTAQQKKAVVLGIRDPSANPMEMEKLFASMSPRYLLYTPDALVKDHVTLYLELKEQPFVWKIEKKEKSKTRTVTICAKNRPGLISKIAGIFTLNNINVLHVEGFTWRNNVALDIFEVTPPPDRIFEQERWDRTARQLKQALTGDLDLRDTVIKKTNGQIFTKPMTSEKPSEVIIDNDTSSFFTIVEVYAYNFPGLLFRITDALFQCRLDIWVAKIATKVDQVVDVFYVRDLDGEKVDDLKRVEQIKSSVMAEVSQIKDNPKNNGS
jgi:[protein-PII] uridylyltransferase